MKRSRKFLALAAVTFGAIGICLYAATSGPANGLHRPVAVSATAYAQHDIIVSGMRLRYIDEGSGTPVILLPGHSSRIEECEQLIGALSGSHRVLVFDFPGSGYSDKPDREYDLRFYEDTVLGFMDAVGIERTALAGGSLGGNLALRLARRAPERFTRIAVVAPGSAWEPKPVLVAFMRVFGGRVLFWPMVRIQSTYWYSGGWTSKDAMLAETFAYYREVMSPAFVRMYWGIAADQLRHSLFDLAPDIRQPTLLIWGDQDNGFDMGSGIRRLHNDIPGSRLLIFPGSGHAVSAERPAELAKALREFLRD